MGIGTALLIFTVFGLLAVLLVSERIRWNLNKHWLDPAGHHEPPAH